MDSARGKETRGERVGFGPEPRPAIGRRVRTLISRYFSGFIFSPVALLPPRLDPPRYLQGNVRQAYHSSFGSSRPPPPPFSSSFFFRSLSLRFSERSVFSFSPLHVLAAQLHRRSSKKRRLPGLSVNTNEHEHFAV